MQMLNIELFTKLHLLSAKSEFGEEQAIAKVNSLPPSVFNKSQLLPQRAQFCSMSGAKPSTVRRNQPFMLPTPLAMTELCSVSVYEISVEIFHHKLGWEW